MKTTARCARDRNQDVSKNDSCSRPVRVARLKPNMLDEKRPEFAQIPDCHRVVPILVALRSCVDEDGAPT
jgi:hypothetical protein